MHSLNRGQIFKKKKAPCCYENYSGHFSAFVCCANWTPTTILPGGVHKGVKGARAGILPPLPFTPAKHEMSSSSMTHGDWQRRKWEIIYCEQSGPPALWQRGPQYLGGGWWWWGCIITTTAVQRRREGVGVGGAFPFPFPWRRDLILGDDVSYDGHVRHFQAFYETGQHNQDWDSNLPLHFEGI